MHIGLIGCGLWGRNILRDLLAQDVRVSVVDSDNDACARALDQGATTASATRPQHIDGWVIATPASSHAEVIADLASDLPILCEKPLCVSLQQLAQIRHSVSGPLHMMDVWRYHPGVEKLAEQAAARSLGEPLGLRLTRANWTSPRSDVDTAWNLAPHELSIFQQIIGEFPQPTAAHAELVDAQIRSLWSHWSSPSGAWMVSEVSNRFEQRRREIRLHCANGVWVYDGVGSRIFGYSGPANARLEAEPCAELELPEGSALSNQLHHWLAFVGGGEAPRSDLGYGAAVVESVARLREMALNR